jgi:hypothetical protein
MKRQQNLKAMRLIYGRGSKMSRKNYIILILAGVVFLFSQAATAVAAQKVTATLTASPKSYAGPCPAVIHFNGKITVTQPGRVQYKFIRSDGAAAPVQTLSFDGAGSKNVGTTWTLGGPGLPSYSGWQAIQVVYPYTVKSNKAHFKMSCRDGQSDSRKKPDLIISIINFSPGKPTTADEITFWVFVKNVGNAPAGASKMSFKVGGETHPPVVNVPALNPGQQFRYDRKVTLRAARNYIAIAKVDVGNNVIESNESNNVLSEKFGVIQAR